MATTKRAKSTTRKSTGGAATRKKAATRTTAKKASAKKASAKKAPARRATTKKTAPRKATAKKTAPKKATAKKAAPRAPARKKTTSKAAGKRGGATAATEVVAEEPEAAPRSIDRTPRAHPDAGLSKPQIQKLHARLLEERDRVMVGIRRHVNDATQQSDPLAEDGDMASRDSQQSYLLRLADKERKLILEIESALRRMTEGEYGVCEGTEEPIGFARLQVRPWTRYSVAHKEILERQGDGE